MLVLWDIDHTLVTARGLGEDLYRVAYRELFGGELPALAPMAGRTDRAIVRQTLELAGVPDPGSHLDPFLLRLAELATAGGDWPQGRSKALPGAAAALAALDGTAAQSVLTGNIRPLAEVKLTGAGLRERLDLEIGAFGESHEDRAELVRLARRRARAARGQDFGGQATVIIGDTPHDITGALRVGARAIGVATGSFPAAELAAAGAHAVLPGLADTRRLLAALAA